MISRLSLLSCRKSWTQNGDKGVKRLFTKEIKRQLKDWLVRRRDNPYPSREEKKTLAQETGKWKRLADESE
jgi:Homeobox KN domain